MKNKDLLKLEGDIKLIYLDMEIVRDNIDSGLSSDAIRQMRELILKYSLLKADSRRKRIKVTKLEIIESEINKLIQLMNENLCDTDYAKEIDEFIERMNAIKKNRLK